MSAVAFLLFTSFKLGMASRAKYKNGLSYSFIQYIGGQGMHRYAALGSMRFWVDGISREMCI